MLDLLRDFFAESDQRPNRFTLYMGDRVRAAREEMGMSEEELARRVNLRPLALLDIEDGKSEAYSNSFVQIACALRKPLAYFLPQFVYEEIQQEQLDPLDQELLLQFLQIRGDGLKRFAVTLVKAVADLDPAPLVLELEDTVHGQIERTRAIQELKEKHRKKRKPRAASRPPVRVPPVPE
jgi:transcriptional regulator with XRE-family HTH domain